MKKSARVEPVNVDILLTNLQNKLHLSATEIVSLCSEEKKPEEISIPISIFSSELGMLESACVYLKDSLKLDFSQIARFLKRDYQTVYTSYRKGKKKMNKKR
jgi:hypothetical protein